MRRYRIGERLAWLLGGVLVGACALVIAGGLAWNICDCDLFDVYNQPGWRGRIIAAVGWSGWIVLLACVLAPLWGPPLRDRITRRWHDRRRRREAVG